MLYRIDLVFSSHVKITLIRLVDQLYHLPSGAIIADRAYSLRTVATISLISDIIDIIDKEEEIATCVKT